MKKSTFIFYSETHIHKYTTCFIIACRYLVYMYTVPTVGNYIMGCMFWYCNKYGDKKGGGGGESIIGVGF